MNTIGYYISIKSKFDNYSTFFNTFKNEQHFSNWCKSAERKGSKIIGINNVSKSIQYTKALNEHDMLIIAYKAFNSSDNKYICKPKGNYTECVIKDVHYRVLFKNNHLSFFENHTQIVPDNYPQIEAFIENLHK